MITTDNLKIGLYATGGMILILTAIIFKPFVIVNAGERGVIMRFGKVENQVLDEGIHPIIPIVTSVKTLSVRVQKTDIKGEAASKDLQQITAELVLNWHIDPSQANKVYQTIGDEEQIINGIISPAIIEVLKASMAKKTAEEIITKRTELKDEIDDFLKNRLKNYGLIVDDVSLVNFAFSPEFTKAIEAKQIAEQQAKQAEFTALKAAKDAQATINTAKGQAEAQKLQRLTLTSELLQQQAIEKWDGKFPMVMGSNGALPFININPDNLSSSPKQ